MTFCTRAPIALSSTVAVLMWAVSLHATGVTASSYFGGEADDELGGVAIGSDGSIFVSGTSASTMLAGKPGSMLAPGGGFVAKLDRNGTKVEWLARIAAAGELKLTPSDEPIVITGSRLTKLAPDGSTITWSGADVGAAISGFDLGPSGDLGLIAGNTVYRFASDGVTQQLKIATGRSNAVGVAIDPLSGDLFASGDQNAGYGTCGGPWRSPFIFRYDATGQKTAKLYDYSGQAACDQGLAADSFFTRLRFEQNGEFWVTGGSDGGNTVLGRAASDLASANAALTGACFSSPCYGWKGAAAPRFVGRMGPDFADFQRATFIVAHFNKQPAACSCDVTNDDGSVPRANSAGLDFVFRTSTGDVVGAGSSAWHFPVLNAWFPAAAYSPGYPAVVSVLDGNLAAMKMATLLPGTGSTRAAAYRGGRLVVVGGAPDNSSWTAPAGQEAQAQATVPAVPEGASLQAKFGGGKKDGFIYVACVTTDAECGNAPAVGAAGATGASGSAGSNNASGGDTPSAAGSSSSLAGVPATAGTDSAAPGARSSGCGCRIVGACGSGRALWALAALVVGSFLYGRRRGRVA